MWTVMKLSTMGICGVLFVAAVSECSGMVNKELPELIRRLEDENKREGKILRKSVTKTERNRQPPVIYPLDSGCELIWKNLQDRFGTGVSHQELCSIAKLISQHFGLPEPNRDAKRVKTMLIKWFYNNWEAISPILCDIALCEEDWTVICGPEEH
jgi:hypothetical protein